MKTEHEMKTPKVCIVGAGMSGMLMAIKLLKQGKNNFVIYEKTNNVGGTWRENRYPGVACDVASFAYCYAFEPNPNWSKRFSGGAEIQQYFESVAKKYQLHDYIRFNTQVEQAQYEDHQWQVTLQDGTKDAFDILVAATGPLHHKKYPAIKGLDSFSGKVFHTADWVDDYDETGKRIGLLGSGSSGVQATWPLAQKAKKLTVFMRTPQWILPTPNPHYGPLAQWLKRKIPLIGWMTRKFYDWVGDQFGRAALYRGFRRRMVAKVCLWYLNKIEDKTLREKLRPDHEAMCKRMIVSDNYYAALQQTNVHVERTDIECIKPEGILTKDGHLHKLDLLVLATGFYPNAWGIKHVVGIDGKTLDDVWKDEVGRNYCSIASPGFPNFFMLIGPNSPITNLSLIDIADIGVDFILRCIDKMERGEFKALMPTHEAACDFGQRLMSSFDDTIWVTGCNSWYLDGSSVPQTWPWLPSKFRKDLKEPNMAHFDTL